MESRGKNHRTKLEKSKGVSALTWCAGLQQKNRSVSEGTDYMKVLNSHLTWGKIQKCPCRRHVLNYAPLNITFQIQYRRIAGSSLRIEELTKAPLVHY